MKQYDPDGEKIAEYVSIQTGRSFNDIHGLKIEKPNLLIENFWEVWERPAPKPFLCYHTTGMVLGFMLSKMKIIMGKVKPLRPPKLIPCKGKGKDEYTYSFIWDVFDVIEAVEPDYINEQVSWVELNGVINAKNHPKVLGGQVQVRRDYPGAFTTVY